MSVFLETSSKALASFEMRSWFLSEVTIARSFGEKLGHSTLTRIYTTRKYCHHAVENSLEAAKSLWRFWMCTRMSCRLFWRMRYLYFVSIAFLSWHRKKVVRAILCLHPANVLGFGLERLGSFRTAYCWLHHLLRGKVGGKESGLGRRIVTLDFTDSTWVSSLVTAHCARRAV